MSSKRKVVLYIAMSLDGYIAGPNDDLSFLSIDELEGEDYGYSEFISSVDTVIMGRKTYDWVMKQVTVFPHANTETYIITRTAKPSKGKTVFYTGNLRDLVLSLQGKEGKNIFVDGGAEIVNELLQENLIDECYIAVIPTLLGDGVRLFKIGITEQRLLLLNSIHFPNGLIQLHYKMNETI
jgi:dihydrofolate reductase